MRVAERFYSLQGEGGRAGEPSLFIRLSGCSAKHACYQSGVRCDTEFESGEEQSLDDLLAWCRSPEHHGCDYIVWTGGEPLDQLTPEAVLFFKESGFLQAIETSGAKPLTPQMATLLDYVVVSPKVAEHVLARHFTGAVRTHAPERLFNVHELRYVRHPGQGIPEPSLAAMRQFLSPHADGGVISAESLRHCVDLCLRHPLWRLSVQQHKLWGVL